jgi:hypothetical protein
MCVEISEVRVGEPQTCGGVSVFPLFAEHASSLDYMLFDEATAAGTLAVREVPDDSRINRLLAENVGDRPVLFVEGEEVRGGKQHRVLVSSVLVSGKSTTRLPVACVEPGRWDCEAREFTSGSCSPPSLRRVLKDEGDYRQYRLWTTMRERLRRLGIRSPTGSMSDGTDALREAAEGLRRGLPYADGASGIAVALGGKIVAIDIFDKPSTLAKLWDRLVQGIALDAAATGDEARPATASDVAVKLYALRNMQWRQVEPVVGLGEAYRGRADDDILATALVMDGTLIHLGASMST